MYTCGIWLNLGWCFFLEFCQQQTGGWTDGWTDDQIDGGRDRCWMDRQHKLICHHRKGWGRHRNKLGIKLREANKVREAILVYSQEFSHWMCLAEDRTIKKLFLCTHEKYPPTKFNYYIFTLDVSYWRQNHQKLFSCTHEKYPPAKFNYEIFLITAPYTGMVLIKYNACYLAEWLWIICSV